MDKTVNIHIAQIILNSSFAKKNEHGLLNVSYEDEIKKQINSTLQYARAHCSQLIVFPELSLPNEASIRRKFKKFSKENNCVIVAGSYYKKTLGGKKTEGPHHYAPTSPVYNCGEVTEVIKFTSSPIEEPVHNEVKLETENKLFVIEDTPAGKIAIAICSDILDTELVALLHKENGIDILCVPALQKNPESHYKTLCEIVRNYQEGLFIAYANVLWRKHSNGGSSIFGSLDRVFKSQLSELKMSEATGQSEHVLRMPDCGRNLIISANLNSKKPIYGKTVKHKSPLKLVYSDYQFLTDRSIHIPKDSKSKSNKIRLVAFDFDGTLVENLKFSWEVLWTELYGEDGGRIRRSLKDNYLTAMKKDKVGRQTHYERWCEECCKYFKAKELAREDVISIFENYSAIDGLLEAIRYLKDKLKCKVILVSGGLNLIAKTILGEETWKAFDDIYINEMSFSENGKELISHIEPTLFDFEGKYEAIASSALKYGCLPAQAAFIGDELNDRDTLSRIHSEGGMSIAFGTHSKISAEEVTLAIRSHDIYEIIQAIERRNNTKSKRVSHIDKLRKHYSDKGGELSNVFMEVRRILSEWVDQLENEGETRDIEYQSIVKHDKQHRKRVLNTVSQMVSPAIYRSNNLAHLSYLADCAVALHDIGFLLPIETLIPGAESYDAQIKSLYSNANHHEITGISLNRIANRNYPLELFELLNKSPFFNEKDSKLKNVLYDTCNILAEITRFHDADKDEVFGAHEELVEAINSATEISVSVDDIKYLRAVLRLSDRLDRHQGRLVDPQQAQQLCEICIQNEKEINSVSGVIQDSMVIKTCDVHCSEYGYLSVKYKPASFKGDDIQEFADNLFFDRLKERHQAPKSWYIRELEQHVDIRVSKPISKARSKARDQVQDAVRSDINHSDTAYFPITTVMKNILRCCPLHSWLQVVTADRYLSGGNEGPFATSKIIPLGQIFDCHSWGLSRLNKAVYVESTNLVKAFEASGGSKRRLCGLASKPKPRWDIYIPFNDPDSHECVALLNAHIVANVTYSTLDVRSYLNTLEKITSPYKSRLIKLINGQVVNSLNHLNDLSYNDELADINRYRAGGPLEDFELCEFFDDLSVEKDAVWKCKKENITTLEPTKLLFTETARIHSTVSSITLFKKVVELLGDAISIFGEFSASLIEERTLPYNSILFESQFITEHNTDFYLFEKFIELSKTAEIEAILLRGDSHLQKKLSAAYELARLGGISVTAWLSKYDTSSKINIAISVLPNTSLSASGNTNENSSNR